MSRKIVFIHGSPRPTGNTRKAAEAAMAAAREAGAEVAEIDACRLEFRAPGCIGCHKCQQRPDYTCAMEDGIAKAVAGLPDFDAIVLCTPVYWMSWTAQLKMVIDRVYSLVKFTEEGITTPLAGKTMAVLGVGGGPVEDNLDLLERQWRVPAGMIGADFDSCLIPNAPYEPGALAGDAEAMAKAADFGKRLAAGKEPE